VSKDIQTRIDNGEVDQEQLMKEATDLLSSLGGEGGLGGMMEMMVAVAQSSGNDEDDGWCGLRPSRRR
jgi:hypothetical protein